MKNLNLFIFVLLVAYLISGCEKGENDDNRSIIGKWIYSKDYSMSFDFQNSTDVVVNGHQFQYRIEKDSIQFSYSGNLYISIRPSKHKFEELTDRDCLMIEDLNDLQFFYGTKGENILQRGIEPNDFIGTWISDNDTLVFRTNERLERKKEIYEYAYSNDTLTLQIVRADIFMGPLKSNYNLDYDTLTINYSSDYYPDIKKGKSTYFR